VQHPVENPEADLVATLLQCLSPERRRELADAAAQTRFLELLGMHHNTTIEQFVRALKADPHWGLLKHLRVSDVISDGKEQPGDGAVETVSSSLAPEVPCALDKPQMHLALVGSEVASEVPAAATAPALASHSASAAKPVGRKRSGDILEDIIKLLEAEPGLRSEEIQKRLERPAVLVKSSLVALRKTNRVRIEGSKRATRYFALSTK
jgi:hypothetical protein